VLVTARVGTFEALSATLTVSIGPRVGQVGPGCLRSRSPRESVAGVAAGEVDLT